MCIHVHRKSYIIVCIGYTVNVLCMVDTKPGALGFNSQQVPECFLSKISDVDGVISSVVL